MKPATGNYKEKQQGRQPVTALVATLVCFIPLCGCGGTKDLNIFGAYFPVWLLAMTIGVAFAFAFRFVLARLRIEPFVGPLVLFYLCIVVSISCLMWLLLA